MQRAGEELRARRLFDDLAEVHDGDLVGHVLYDRHIVRNEKIRDLAFALQPLQQVEDLRSDGDVERRDRLIAHDQVGLRSERARDIDTLALTAGELVRKQIALFGAEADRLEQLSQWIVVVVECLGGVLDRG